MIVYDMIVKVLVRELPSFKKTISYSIIKCIETNVIENVGIILNLSNQTICKIICVYFPGGRCSPEIKAKFKNDLRKLASIREPFVICGDLNCRHRDWGCTRANSWGNIIY